MKETKADLLHELEERLRLETLLADISTRFINLPANRVDSVLEEAQRRVCECLGLDLSSLWQWSAERPYFLRLTHLHSPPEGPVGPKGIDAKEMFPWQFEKLLRKETLVFSSTEHLPPEAVRDKESRRLFGIKSSVGLPLFTGDGPLIGILTFNTLQVERSWPTEVVNTLTFVAQIFSNALARKQSDGNLRKSEARLAAAIDAAALGFYEMDGDLCLKFLDDRMRTFLGTAPEDELHAREFWLAHVHPEDLPHIREQSRQVLTGGVDRFRGEYRYLHPERGMTWLRHLSRVLKRDAAGRAVQVIGVMQDITERRLEEETLLASKAALRDSQKDLRRLAGRLISTQEEELRRLSRELHDDLTQRLAVLAIEAGKLESQSGSTEHPVHAECLQKISLIKEQLISVSEDVHRISRQLHPTILDDLGLVRAIESECAVLQLRENLVIIFKSEDVPDRIANDISLCLYRIVQEGLKNIISHSGATRCEIFLKTADDTLCLSVKDEGMGFNKVEVRNKPGLGLSSMRERVLLVQGDFAIDSRPGQGTVIRVSVPLQRSDT